MTGRSTSPEPRSEIRVPYTFVQFVYGCVFFFNALLIAVTWVSDLTLKQAPGIAQLDLKAEGNFAVWYSSALLLLVGGAALVIAFNPPPVSIRPTVHRFVWMMWALFFIGLSADESLRLHERLGNYFTDTVGRVPGLTEGGWGVFGWIVALLPLILVFVVGMAAMLRSWLKLHPFSRTSAALALACWIGVIVAEVVEAQLAPSALDHLTRAAAEEGLEISGATLFLIAFCELLRRQHTSASPLAATRRAS